jgi:hypothetical protein
MHDETGLFVLRGCAPEEKRSILFGVFRSI